MTFLEVLATIFGALAFVLLGIVAVWWWAERLIANGDNWK